jgi:DHA1 family tetracycline resistance protein-like MFS transporter
MINFQKRVSLFTILLLSFIDYLSIGLVYPMFSAMIIGNNGPLLPQETSHATRCLWLGIILALMPMLQFFSGPILGTLSDRIGRKKIIIISFIFGIFGYMIAIMGIKHMNIWLLALSRIIIGIASGNEAVGSAAVADISTEKEKAKNFGLFGMAGGLGFTAGPFIGGKLSTLNIGIFSGYTVPFLFAGLMCVINLILFISLFNETHTTKQTNQDFSFGLINIKKVFYAPVLVLLFSTVFLYNFGYSFYWEFIPVFWITKYNFDAEMIGNRLALGAIVYALSSGLLIRFLESKFKSEKILFYAFTFGAIFLCMPLLFSSPLIFWLYIPLQECTIALIFPETSAYISNKFQKDIQGEMMGVYQSVRSLALILSPLAAGTLLGITVSMPMIIGSCTFILAAYIIKHISR